MLQLNFRRTPQPPVATRLANRRTLHRHRIGERVDVALSSGVVSAIVTDISGGGCRLTMGQRIEPAGSFVSFAWKCRDGSSILLACRIVTKHFSRMKTLEYGVCFTGLTQTDRERLVREVSVLQRTRPVSPATALPVAQHQHERDAQRRLHTRTQHLLPTQYRVGGRPRPGKALLLDISEGGARLSTRESLEANWSLELILRLRAEPRASVSAPFKEVRVRAHIVRQSESSGVHTYGLAFTALPTLVRAALAAGCGPEQRTASA